MKTKLGNIGFALLLIVAATVSYGQNWQQNDLIFNLEDSKRALETRWLWDINPLRRTRLPSTFQALVQVPQILFASYLVSEVNRSKESLVLHVPIRSYPAPSQFEFLY